MSLTRDQKLLRVLAGQGLQRGRMEAGCHRTEERADKVRRAGRKRRGMWAAVRHSSEALTAGLTQGPG